MTLTKSPQAETVAEHVNHMAGFIQQYNDGLITSHEMANSLAHIALHIVNMPEQGCDGYICIDPVGHNSPKVG